MDRKKKGAATPIKDRRQCACNCNRNIGCCRAFSAVAAIEQKLVGCDTSGVDQDCEGRLMDDAFQFIQHHGISTQAKTVITNATPRRKPKLQQI
ncbi:hypothetical protein C1H46_013843 [Malus baccata]|uniref:Peptidase C1A papain C-terminal domain-containing protein n=1 Tax=Malus baccata TaxID=106549 RepID=A0A540MP97_MALBA|nr:hypothetical protein C1H46_013843 [Malus baccata]